MKSLPPKKRGTWGGGRRSPGEPASSRTSNELPLPSLSTWRNGSVPFESFTLQVSTFSVLLPDVSFFFSYLA